MPRSVAPRARFVSAFAKSRVATGAALVVAAFVLLALFTPAIAPQNPYDPASLSFLDGRLPPGSRGAHGMLYLLGTDNQGRDILSAMLYGLRTSLLVGTVSGACALAIGTSLGAWSGFRGGAGGAAVMALVDAQLSVPAMLVALVLVALLGRGESKVMIALVWSQWTLFARTARATTLVEREREYVDAARAAGAGPARILFHHILPNCAGSLAVVGTVVVANAIALEATLSFLGVGLPVSRPSLGLLIANGYAFMLSGQYWMSLYPGLALAVLVLALNLVGDRIGDLFDPTRT